MRNHIRWTALFAGLALTAGLLAVNPAPSGAATAPTTPIIESGVTVVVYDPATGVVLSRTRQNSSTEGKRLSVFPLVSKDSGVGGSSSASGCAKFSVWQSGYSTLHTREWKFTVWTDACWVRSTQTVTWKHKGYDIWTDGNEEFLGIIQQNAWYYDFSTDDGHPRSAYHHMKQGSFKGQSKLPLIPDSHDYPKNTVDVYYNGTYTWYTS